MPKLQNNVELSKVEIDLNQKWRLTTDRYNYILERKVRARNGKYSYKEEAYFNTFEQAIDSILELEIRDSEAKSLRAMKKEIERIKLDIAECCNNITKRAVKGKRKCDESSGKNS